MALIQSVFPAPIETTEVHPMWTIPEHMYFTAPKVRTTRHIPGYATVRGSLHRQSEAQAAMMRAISFNCRSNHGVVSGLILSKNRLKARLRAAGEMDVSDDERPPEAPPADLGFDFPSGPEWADFFPGDPGVSGSGQH